MFLKRPPGIQLYGFGEVCVSIYIWRKWVGAVYCVPLVEIVGWCCEPNRSLRKICNILSHPLCLKNWELFAKVCKLQLPSDINGLTQKSHNCSTNPEYQYMLTFSEDNFNVETGNLHYNQWQSSNIKGTLGNKIVDHSDVVGASLFRP